MINKGPTMIQEDNEYNELTQSTFADDLAGDGVIGNLYNDEDSEKDELLEEFEEFDDLYDSDQLTNDNDEYLFRDNVDMNTIDNVVEHVIGETILSAKNMIIREVLRIIAPDMVKDPSKKSPKKGSPGRPTKESPRVRALKKKVKKKTKTVPKTPVKKKTKSVKKNAPVVKKSSKSKKKTKSRR